MVFTLSLPETSRRYPRLAGSLSCEVRLRRSERGPRQRPEHALPKVPDQKQGEVFGGPRVRDISNVGDGNAGQEGSDDELEAHTWGELRSDSETEVFSGSESTGCTTVFSGQIRTEVLMNDETQGRVTGPPPPQDKRKDQKLDANLVPKMPPRWGPVRSGGSFTSRISASAPTPMIRCVRCA